MWIPMMTVIKKNICYLSILFLIGFLPFDMQAQCPDSETALGRGRTALSLFYGNQYLQQDRLQMGVSTDDSSLDEIVPMTDDSVCTQLESHIMQSSDFPQERKNQSKVYFKNEQTGRFFVIFYTEPAHPGWNTFVYVLNDNFDKLGAFGV